MLDRSDHRLDRTVVPTAYRLSIDAHLDDGTFTGRVEIDAEVQKSTRRIVCNSRDLQIHSAVLVRPDAASADDDPTESIRLDIEVLAETERLALGSPSALAPGPITLTIEFSGRLNEQLVGFYRSTYTDDSPTNTRGDQRSLGVTQFEAPYARAAFPCWDEPAFKATFEISLTVDPGLIAVSNGAEVTRTEEPTGRTRFEFAPTMSMSTYLVAWVIGDLEASRPVRAGSTTLRVLHRPGKAHLTKFALECGAHAVAWFEEYYGIAYPGDKLDLIAVPDFAFGAMENLGCVTFRENLLLVDPTAADRSELERLATVIEHEIAHMWFGDLVTMDWWNGIWLNEAFATFMEFSCADDFRPAWDIWTSFGLSKSAAFETDGLASTRAIEFEVATPADAEAMFDILTYEKGASVLAMFEKWTGRDAFRNGVRSYLTEHAYSNTDTADLWASLTAATGVDVGSMMDTWILQGGHPIVEAVPSDTGIVLRQERFGYVGGDDADPATWVVPARVTIATRADDATISTREQTVLLDGRSAAVDLGVRGSEVEWVNINTDFSGFYRSAYSPDLRSKLLAQVGTATSLERYGLLDDSWALVGAGRLELAPMLATLMSIAAVEHEPSVWRRISGIIGALSNLVPHESAGQVASLARAAVDSGLDLDAIRGGDSGVSRAGVSASELELRSIMFRLAGTLGADSAVVDAARWIQSEAPGELIDPDLAAAALDVSATHGDAGDFEQIVNEFRTAPTPQRELRALGALTRFGDPALIERLCVMCTDEVRTQNAPYTLAQAMANPRCGEQVWQFVAAHWDELLDRFPSSSIVRMVAGARAFSDRAIVEEIQQFFVDRPLPQAGRTLDQHLERLRINVALRERLASQMGIALRDAVENARSSRRP